MNATWRPGPRSLSGHALEGCEVVRLVYIDEAGISNARQEPFLVVAAVLLHADNQLVAVERHLDKLVERWIPEEQRDGFVFHATELFNGGGPIFKRHNDAWPLEKRLRLADDLAAAPKRLGLKLAFGGVEKATFPGSTEMRAIWSRLSPKDQIVGLHVSAFLSCVLVVDRWMRKALPNEVCMLIVEDNEQARTMIREVTNHHKRPESGAGMAAAYQGFFPLKKIKEDPLFQPKKPSSVLQLADFWAYVAKKTLMGDERYERFAKPMWPCLMPAIWSRPPERPA